jgi:hypothetical protein
MPSVQAPYYPEFAVNNTYGIKGVNDTTYSYMKYACNMVSFLNLLSAIPIYFLGSFRLSVRFQADKDGRSMDALTKSAIASMPIELLVGVKLYAMRLKFR